MRSGQGRSATKVLVELLEQHLAGEHEELRTYKEEVVDVSTLMD